MAVSTKWWIGVIVAALVIGVGVHVVADTPKADPSVARTETTAPLTAAQTWSHIGDFATVQYQVRYATTDSGGDEFLNQESDYLSGFTAVVFRDSLDSFSNDPIATYQGETIVVTGWIQSYENHPEIVVSHPSQIHLAPTPAPTTTTTTALTTTTAPASAVNVSGIPHPDYCDDVPGPATAPALPAGWPATLAPPFGYALARVQTFADNSHQVDYACPAGQSVTAMAAAIQSDLESQGWTVTRPKPESTDQIFLWFKHGKNGGTVTINDEYPVSYLYPTGNV
jgi:hypothetical protein